MTRLTYRDAFFIGRILSKANYYDVRDEGGKFSESPGGGGGDKKTKPKPKPKGTPQEIANQNRAQMARDLGIGSDLDGAMARLDAGMGGRADEEKAQQLVDRGLAVKDPDTGRYDLSPEGKAYFRAAKKGDVEAAKAALGRGEGRAEKTKAKAQAAADKEKAKAEATADKEKAKAEQEKEKAKGGGGGGGKASPEDKAKEKAEAKAKQIVENRAAVSQALVEQHAGFPPNGAKALTSFADGGTIDERTAGVLAVMGLLIRDAAGGYRLSPEGKKTVQAMDKGDARAALDGVSAGRDAAKRRAEAEEKAKTKAKKMIGSLLQKRATTAPPLFVQFDADALQKADGEERIVYGIASTPDLDGQPGIWEGQRYIGDIVDAGAIQEALTDYLAWANIREMHEPKAVGVALEAKVIDGQLRLAARIEDSDAWHKVKTGVYKGFSIGGRALKAILQKLPDGRYVRRILKLLLTEISLVDRPANPAARILLFKGADMADEQENTEQASADVLAQLAALAELAKGAPDPMKATTQLQAIRDELELSGDVEGASLMTQAISLVLQAAGEAEAPAGETETVEEETETEAPAEDVEMLDEAEEDDPAALMMAARSSIRKASRLRMGKRLPGIEAIAKQMLQLAADGGSQWALKLLKAEAPAQPVDMKAISTELTKYLQPHLQSIAGGILAIHERTEKLEAQPAPGGPVTRLTAITKRLGNDGEGSSKKPTIDADYIAHLKRMVVIETNAITRGHYEKELAALTTAQQ